jgi:hypothetical protein
MRTAPKVHFSIRPDAPRALDSPLTLMYPSVPASACVRTVLRRTQESGRPPPRPPCWQDRMRRACDRRAARARRTEPEPAAANLRDRTPRRPAPQGRLGSPVPAVIRRCSATFGGLRTHLTLTLSAHHRRLEQLRWRDEGTSTCPAADSRRVHVRVCFVWLISTSPDNGTLNPEKPCDYVALLGRLRVCLLNCKYDIVKRVCASLGFSEVRGEDEQWDLYWTDLSVAAERVARLHPFQVRAPFPRDWVHSVACIWPATSSRGDVDRS